MAQDVVSQIVESIKIDRRFAIQIDESVDVSDEAELLIYVRYFHVRKDAIVDEIFGFKHLPEYTRGDYIFKILDNFVTVELDLEWKWCVSVTVYTDGAASMIGYKSGFVCRIHEKNANVTWQHCIIHRENLVAKKITPDLHETLNVAVKVINLIKSHALNSRLFKKMC